MAGGLQLAEAIATAPLGMKGAASASYPDADSELWESDRWAPVAERRSDPLCGGHSKPEPKGENEAATVAATLGLIRAHSPEKAIPHVRSLLK
jgi:hypothetical protein